MIEVTEKATEKLKEYLEEREIESAIRIFVSQIGWGGPSLGMALDEPNEKDQVVELDGLTYLVDSTLMNQAKPIKVDYMEDAHCSGFSITSTLSQPDACGSCSC
jgi:iron-sulfur cluster assembly protein